MNLNKITKIFELAIVGVAVFALSFMAASLYLRVGDIRKISFDSIKNNIPKLFVVESGSMEPAIKTGSIVITQPSDSYAQNDVISFKSGKKVITHRVMYRSYPDGVNAAAVYQTSGDANEDFDPFVVKQEQVVGKVVYDIPYIGYVANFAKQPYGFILLVIVPATIVIYEELKNLLGQIYLAFIEYLKKKKKKDISISVKKSKKSKGLFMLSRTSVLLPVFGALFVFTGLAASYFSDKETSAGNVMQAGEWGPKIAQTLVINEVMPHTDCLKGNAETQWLEVYNGYSFSVNPKNFKITDGSITIDLVTANNLTIAPGGLLLLAHDNGIWGTGPNNCWDNHGTATGNLGGTLDINSLHLQLIDTKGTSSTIDDEIIDDVKWGTEAPPLFPLVNQSIGRQPNGLDTALGANFEVTDFTVYEIPNPGQLNP